MISRKEVMLFQRQVYLTYKTHSRAHLPWRQTQNPYHILVSELMLQQTQAERVVPKYLLFIKSFRTISELAKAKPSKILRVWQGLGYNRRALYLKKIAETIAHTYGGKFPEEYSQLIALKGIGQSTAGAILNFAYNKATPFIETNIRTTYIHHFFKNSSSVSDTDILSLVSKTIDNKNPRQWFYALYDYGTQLKTSLGKRRTQIHVKSTSYIKQSKFLGSNRQIRGEILRILLKIKKGSVPTIIKESKLLISIEAKLVKHILTQLEKEGFVSKRKKADTFAIL